MTKSAETQEALGFITVPLFALQTKIKPSIIVDWVSKLSSKKREKNAYSRQQKRPITWGIHRGYGAL